MTLRVFLGGVVLTYVLLVSVTPAVACAVCFGKSDSALAQGMNMGIFSLLAVVACMLSTIAGFFVFLARRSARVEAFEQARFDSQTTATSNSK